MPTLFNHFINNLLQSPVMHYVQVMGAFVVLNLILAWLWLYVVQPVRRLLRKVSIKKRSYAIARKRKIRLTQAEETQIKVSLIYAGIILFVVVACAIIVSVLYLYFILLR